MPKLKKVRASKPRRTTKPKYKSKFEAKVADLLSAKKASFIYEPVVIPYTLDLKYKPDWELGKDVYLEAKGKFDYEDRRKMAAVVEQNPWVDVRMVFMRNQKLGRGSKMTYGGWCDLHKIKWSVFPQLPFSDKELECVPVKLV